MTSTYYSYSTKSTDSSKHLSFDLRVKIKKLKRNMKICNILLSVTLQAVIFFPSKRKQSNKHYIQKKETYKNNLPLYRID